MATGREHPLPGGQSRGVPDPRRRAGRAGRRGGRAHRALRTRPRRAQRPADRRRSTGPGPTGRATSPTTHALPRRQVCGMCPPARSSDEDRPRRHVHGGRGNRCRCRRWRVLRLLDVRDASTARASRPRRPRGHAGDQQGSSLAALPDRPAGHGRGHRRTRHLGRHPPRRAGRALSAGGQCPVPDGGGRSRSCTTCRRTRPWPWSRLEGPMPSGSGGTTRGAGRPGTTCGP